MREPRGPVVSPTGFVYELGTPPSETRFSQTATLYLQQPGSTDRALGMALEGIEADSTNPIHFFLAGTAYARLGQYEEANRMFAVAERIYPAYEIDVEPEREAAWAEAFNRGAGEYRDGDAETAIEAWRGAIQIFDLRPEAHRNLAQLLSSEGRYDEAIDVYQGALAGLEKRPATRVFQEQDLLEREEAARATEVSLAQLLLIRNRFAEAEPLLRRQLERDSTNVDVRSNLALALVGLGRDEEARAIYSALLSESGLEATQLFNLGVALFRADDFDGASRAFQQLTENQRDSRDAWFNYANSLFAAQDWATLTSVGDRLIELDPLNENAALITARAYLEAGDQQAALRGVARIRGTPVYVEGLTMRLGAADTRIQGRVAGNQAPAGTPIRLRFAFYNDTGEVGSEIVNMSAPASGEREPFEVNLAIRALGYSYELLAEAP